MDALVVLGTTSTILFGIIMLFIGYPELDTLSDHHGERAKENAHHFEVSATLLVLISLGKVLESYSKQKTVSMLTDLA